MPRLSEEPAGFDPAPVDLVLPPVAALLAQFILAAPMTELSRSSAIADSAELISDIEDYHARNGALPAFPRRDVE